MTAATEFQRNALAPSLLAAVALLVGIPLVGTDYGLVVLFVVAILAVIVGWFALQARQWWWAPVMAIIAVAWNPIFPLGFDGIWWTGAHVAAAAVFIAAGATIKVPRKAATRES